MVTLTGCANQEYTLQINDDNTCNFTCEVTINNDVYSLLGTYGVDTAKLNKDKTTKYENELDDVDALFQELAVIYHDFGYSITPINDTINIGFSASKKYPNIEELNKEIKELNQLNICGFNFEITHEKTSFVSEYKVYGGLKYILDSDIDMENELINENFNQLFDTSLLKATCKVIMPASTSVTNSDGTFDSNQFVWTATYDEGAVTPVHIISSLKNTSMYAIAVVSVVIILAIVALFGSRFLRKMKAKKNYEFYEDDLEDVDE